jgi:hypothetical protein
VTQAERVLLPSLIDEVVALETVQGRHLLAQILVVFDEGETPDLFCVEVIRGTDGAWVQKKEAGHSILLSEIAQVGPPPAVILEPNQ